MRGRDAHLLRHAPAILRHPGRIVVRPDAGIEAFVNPVGHAALAGEEGVTQAWDGGEQRRGDRHEGAPRASCRSSANPASAVRLGSETASTLNISPMPPRPPPIRRFKAAEMSSETS